MAVTEAKACRKFVTSHDRALYSHVILPWLNKRPYPGAKPILPYSGLSGLSDRAHLLLGQTPIDQGPAN